MSRLTKLDPYVFLMPALFFVIGAELLPAGYTIYLSFTKWNIITSPEWTGLSNYLQVFSSPQVLNAFKNTILWLIGTLGFPIVLALFLAVIINSVRFQGFFKTVFYIPVTLAPTVAAVIWKIVYSTQNGAINSLFKVLGLGSFQLLANSSINTFLMIGVWAWQFLGLNLVLFLVGLQSLPKAPIEAAKVDGANFWQIFYHVTLPLLKPISMLVIANAMINTTRMFAIPWVMTHGGPARASETLAISMYRESFLLSNMGYGSAIAVIIALVTLIFAWRNLKAFEPSA
ncbi:MAG: sugar ABC transporter permease [Candidatus Bipolaricaulota bacterium]|nr:sugar ABC transporter permease [Candidatus Bipolaricaulota bacterium]